jgi:transmembrane sensor
MNSRGTASGLNAQILDEAAEWLVELSATADDETRRQFDAWLRKSPEHVRAYFELLPIWEDGTALPACGEHSVDELIAMGKTTGHNVVRLDRTLDVREPTHRPGAPAQGAFWRRPFRRRAPLAALAASAALVAIGTGLWLHFQRNVYGTEIGEQRSLALADGSTVTLNAHSRVRVHFTASRRDVELLQGQALFNVAKDAARPFVVTADETQVRAVGTQFDVNRRMHGTVVTVVEGRVAVVTHAAHVRQAAGDPRSTDAAQATHDSEIFLTAGEQATVDRSGAPQAEHADLDAATAWTQRRLVFDAATLGEVVEEFNRYTTRKLVLRDPSLERFPITAAFSSPDPTSLIRFLEAQPTLRVTTTNDEIEIDSRR